MSDITEITKVDWVLFFITAFAFLFALKQIIEIVSYFKKKYRIKFGHETDKETIENRIDKLEKHDKWQYEQITNISEGVEDIKVQLTNMQTKMDETEMAKLKDTIVKAYNKYKDIGEWSKFESDAFWSLFKRYEAHGGNGYCHDVIEPIMRKLHIID